jgi:hypothetical protein
LKNVGFKCDDSNAYKLVSGAADMFLADLIDSITKIHMRRNKSSDEAEDAQSKAKLSKKIRYSQIKTLTLHDLMEELEVRFILIFAHFDRKREFESQNRCITPTVRLSKIS